jgi:undecaprenyl-diphosphatase
MLETLLKLDTDWFIGINHARNGFFDLIMPWLSSRWIWIPLYIFLAWKLFRYYGKQAGIIILAIGVMTVISDQTANIFKNNVMRHRPCHNVELKKTAEVFTPEGCGGPYGFYSAHAANTMALALMIILLVRRKNRDAWRPWLWLVFWATLVAYSRVYLGVHYPMDVICGAVSGIIFSGIIYYALVKFYLEKRNA